MKFPALAGAGAFIAPINQVPQEPRRRDALRCDTARTVCEQDVDGCPFAAPQRPNNDITVRARARLVSSRDHHRPDAFRLRGMTAQRHSKQASKQRPVTATRAAWVMRKLRSGLSSWIAISSKARWTDQTNAINANRSRPDGEMMRRE
jgi:hypothetical protein